MLKEKKFLLLLALINLSFGARDLRYYAEEREQINLTEYILGDVPIILTAPHGGDIPVSGSDPRVKCSDDGAGPAIGDCKNATLTKDANTKEILQDVYDAIIDLSNQKVWTVASKMHRKFADLNRATLLHSDQGCCLPDDFEFSSKVRDNYETFHSLINDWKTQVQANDEVGLIVEFHGQGHDHQMLEVGLGVSASKLRRMQEEDYDYNPDDFNHFSLKNSAKLPLFGLEGVDAEINTLTGPHSFGAIIQRELLKLDFESPTDRVEVVPSPDTPAPEGSYFAGKTSNPARYSDDSNIDGIQLEAPKYMRGNWDDFPDSDNYENRKNYARAVAKAIIEYATQIGILEKNYYVSLNGQCNSEDHRILDQKSCEIAAEALGLPDQRAQDLPYFHQPKGCFQVQDGQKRLKYNSRHSADTTENESNFYRAICDYNYLFKCPPGFHHDLCLPGESSRLGECDCLPYAYIESSNGICPDKTLIKTKQECEVAYERLVDLTGDADDYASITKNKDNPKGCYFREQSETRKLWFNKKGKTDVTKTERRALCRVHPNDTNDEGRRNLKGEFKIPKFNNPNGRRNLKGEFKVPKPHDLSGRRNLKGEFKIPKFNNPNGRRNLKETPKFNFRRGPSAGRRSLNTNSIEERRSTDTSNFREGFPLGRRVLNRMLHGYVKSPRTRNFVVLEGERRRK